MRSTDDCLGDCGPGDGAFDADFDDFHEYDENDSDISDEDMAEIEDAETQGSVRYAEEDPSRVVQQNAATNQTPSSPIIPRNLDRGGDVRWDGAEEDFGEEP